MAELSELARAWAKCVAYIRCDKHDAAREWFVKLAHLLGYQDLLK